MVQHLIQVRDDISAHKAMIVSSNGFQSGAVRLAQQSRIALWQFVDRRFLHVNHHMAALYEHQAFAATAVEGLCRYLEKRGINLNLPTVLKTQRNPFGHEGVSIYSVGLVGHNDWSNPAVSPSASEDGLTTYETPFASQPSLNFTYEIIRAIYHSGTNEGRILYAYLRLARNRWTSGTRYADWLQHLLAEPSYDEMFDHIQQMDVTPMLLGERRRQEEKKQCLVAAEEQDLQRYLSELGEINREITHCNG